MAQEGRNERDVLGGGEKTPTRWDGKGKFFGGNKANSTSYWAVRFKAIEGEGGVKMGGNKLTLKGVKRKRH